VIRHFTHRLPATITPDLLTALSVSGAVLTAAAFVLCWVSGWFLVLVALGLFLNWFGDSFDGALARYRRQERHKTGFILDRSCDILSFVLIFAGLGFSPYLSCYSAAMILFIYLLHTQLTIMRLAVLGVHYIGIGGFGATEGRILIFVWGALGQIIGRDFAQFRIHDVLALDILSTCLLIAAFPIIGLALARDIRRIETSENIVEFPRFRQLDARFRHGDGNVVAIGRGESSSKSLIGTQ
jgi:phosphatidylglycerophosphate synthase